ncbi:MAG: ABC transporter ATP-binding protein [Fibrobacteraceae bacterium]|nr:ABC transporter ATP-binding protein [Fibrobacteraceae bacterium]
MIQVENLQKTYHTGFLMRPKKVLSDVSFHVPKGSVYGFIGPNGAGKSTTIKLLTGLLRKDSGKILVAGFSPSSSESRKHLGYSPEQPYFYDYLTGRELMRFYGRLSGIEGKELEARIEWALSLVNANKDWADRRLRTYSKGMMQRVGIAQAILGRPELLILDEPMSGLDPMGRKDVREAIVLLNKEGVTVFYSSHLLSDVETISHRVAMIVGGRIVREGTVDEITSNSSAEYHIHVSCDIPSEDVPEGVLPQGTTPREWICKNGEQRDRFLNFCLQSGLPVVRVEHQRPSLEDVLTEEIARAES